MSPRTARRLAGLAVLAVAVIAAIVSFAHIESLALANGYSIATARLLPFSVDGLIVASSLSLVTGGRPGLARVGLVLGGRPGLARVGLVLGVAATIAANVVFGVLFGVTGAVVNSWPAVAFIVSSEILVGMVRGTWPTPARDESAETVADIAEVPQDLPAVPLETPVTAPSAAQDGPEGVPLAVPHPVPVEPLGVPASPVSPVPGKRARTVASDRAQKRTPAVKTKAPEKVFAAEIEAGELPSLRAIKERMHVGTDRARVIRVQLAETMQEAPEAA